MENKKEQTIESLINQKGGVMMKLDDLLIDILNQATFKVKVGNASIIKLMEAGIVINAVNIDGDSWVIMDNKTFEEEYDVNELELDNNEN